MVEVQISDMIMGLQGKLPNLGKNNSAHREHYHPERTPPDFQMAINHGNARRVYKSRDAPAEDEKLCPCCVLPLDQEQLPLNCKLSKLYSMGCGFSLYFRFLKYCGLLLIIILAISGLYGLFSNLHGKDCAPSEDGTPSSYCTEGFILTFSIANKRDSPSGIKAQLALNFVAMVFVMIFLHYIRYQTRRVAIDAEDRTITPSDYTLQLKRVKAETTDEELKTWLEGLGDEQNPVKVVKVVRSYDIREYVVHQKRKEVLKDQREVATDPEQLRIIDDELESVKQKLGRFKRGGLKYAESVYVTFEHAQQADYIRTKFIKSSAKRFVDFISRPFHSTFDRLHGNTVKVKRAPEPTGILWENIGYTPREKFNKRILTNSMTIFLILVSFVLITLTCWAQIHAPDVLGEHTNALRLLSLIGSLFIYVINTLLSMTLRWFADYEKHSTYTGYYTGLSGKLCMAMFINTAFTTLFAKIALASEFADRTGISNYISAVNFYNTGGLLENILYVVLTGALLSPFMVIFDPWYFLKIYQQRSELKKGDQSKLTQAEAHALFEGTNFDLSYKYALLVKSMLFAAFYAPALPSVLIITLIGIWLSYWTDKYVLLRRSVLPFSIDDDLTRLMTEYLEWMPFAFAAGNMMFTLILRTSDNQPVYDDAGLGLMWATLVLSLLNIVFPMEALNERMILLNDTVTETQTYNEARTKFGTDYDIANPITRKRALKQYIRLTTQKGESPELGNLLLKGFEKDILKLIEETKEGKESPTEKEAGAEQDLTCLDEYVEHIKEKPLAESNDVPQITQIQNVLQEHQIDYGAFMTQFGTILGKQQGKEEPKAEGEDEESGLLNK